MTHIFKRELRANAKGVLIWGLVMLALSAVGFGEYGFVMNGSGGDSIIVVVEMMPRVVQAIFGMADIPVNTPAGWYVCMYLWCSIVAFLFSALTGATIIAKEENDKTAEFLFTRPVSRRAAVAGKTAAAVVCAFIIVLVCFVTTMAIFYPQVKSELSAGYIAASMTGMFVTALVFLFIGLWLSSVCRDKGRPVQVVSAVLFGTFFLHVVLSVFDNLKFTYFLTPFRFFDPVRVLSNGLEPLFILLSVCVMAVCGFFTFSLFNRRDLRN